MNILFVNSFDLSPNTGGVNRITYVISQKIMADCHAKCYLAFFADNAAPTVDLCAKIKLSNPLDTEQLEQFLIMHKIDIIQINFIQKKYIAAIPAIYSVAKRNNIRVIYCFHMRPGFEYSMYGSVSKLIYSIKKRKEIYVEARYLLLTWLRFIVKYIAIFLLRPKYRQFHLNSDSQVLLSKNYMPEYKQIVGETANYNIGAIGNALTFNEYISREEIELKQKEILVVVQMLEHYKRISLILKIWKEIEKTNLFNDWKLTMVGYGKDLDYLQYFAKKLNLKRCHFEGRQAPLLYYKRASVFMMTSSSEGWPMTLMEALQMGVVPIVFDSFGALHDIIDDGNNCIIVPNNDTRAYVNALTGLMLHENKRIQMAENAVESSKRFTLENVACQWMDSYSKI